MARSTKPERYARIRDQIADLMVKTEDPVARRATTAAILHRKVPGVSWTGFYMLRGGDLTVDAYQGPLACIVLTRNTGVCWAAVDRGEPVVVPDVHAWPGHVACDGRSRSEVVVPLFGPEDEIVGVLDLDSRLPANFDEEDAAGLSQVVRLLQ